MSERGQSIGGNAIIRAPHITSRNMRRKPIQLAGCNPLHPVTRLHGPEARTTMRNSTSMQTGTNPSLGLFASAFGGLCGEENAPHSFSSRAALKLSQVAQTTLDITSGLFIGLFAFLYFLSPFIALFCLLFPSFH